MKIDLGKRKYIGYGIITTTGGVCDIEAIEVLTLQQAKTEALRILKEYCDEADENYEEKLERIEELVGCPLNDDDDLIIIPIKARYLHL